jgi:hypothetical protein
MRLSTFCTTGFIKGFTDKYLSYRAEGTSMPPKARMNKVLELSLPSEDLKKKITEAAKARGFATRSKYIVSLFESDCLPPKPSSAPEMAALREELAGLRTTLEAKDLLLKQRENELRQIRGAAFLDPAGYADVDLELLKVLRAGPIHDHKLLDRMGATDPNAMRAVSRQLQLLEKAGLITKTSRGWSMK